jgi:hypothetical protein
MLHWTRRALRLLPSLVVLALIFAAAAGMRPQAAPGSTSALCDPVVSNSNDGYLLPAQWGLTQPFDPTTNVQVCSLRVQTGYNYNDFRILSWDDASSAPDASTPALRYFSYDASHMQYNHLRVDLGSRPVVTKRLGHLADPPRTRLALDFSNSYYFANGEQVYYDHAGPASIPGALEYSIVTGTRQPLGGPHPVISYGVCPGDAAAQAQVLSQCVMTANASLDTVWSEFCQPFMVPASVSMQFAEFAQDAPYVNDYDYYVNTSLVRVLDAAAGGIGDGTLLGQALMPAVFDPLPQWTSHLDFDVQPALRAGHPYAMMVRTNHVVRLRARVLTGAESADFTDEIGPLYGRTAPDAPWVVIPGRALSMRVIGTPLTSVDAPQPPLVPGVRLKLSLSPNPSRGAVFASWSGGSGRAIFDVLDARGRRVNGATLPAAQGGRWLWSGAAADGRVAPPGLYFVRVHDDAGRSAVERVVLVR